MAAAQSGNAASAPRDVIPILLTEYDWRGHAAYSSMDTVGVGVILSEMHKAGVWHCLTQAHYDRWHRRGIRLAKAE